MEFSSTTALHPVSDGFYPRPRARKLSELLRAGLLKARLRYHVRYWAGQLLALFAKFPERNDWIFVPCYHMIFDDERKNCERQIKTMRNWGDFIFLDDTVDVLQNPTGVRGRYFCVTFEDGFLKLFYQCFSHPA